MKLRVAHLTTVPSSLTFHDGHVRHLLSRGFDVHALSSPGEDLDRFEAETSASVHAIPIARQPSPIADAISLTQLVRTLRRIRPSIVHAHTPKAGLLGMMAARIVGTPVRIYHLHGLPLETRTGPYRSVLRSAERTACGLAHQVVAVSNSLRQAVIGERICDAAKVCVLQNGSIAGVDSRRFSQESVSKDARINARRRYGLPENAIVMLFIGRIVKDKGIIELEQAWQTLRNLYPSLHRLCVGPLESGDRVPRAVLDRMRLDPRVRMPGQVLDTPSIYGASDIVVLPTHREGFGMVTLEAAAMSLPVVSTRVTGIVDAVQDGVTGTLVDPESVGALASAIQNYIRRPDLRLRHGTTARARAEREFRPETLYHAVEELYCKLITTRESATAPDASLYMPRS